ncbi:MAG: hypothetical protein HZA66_19315 [Rhodopseudomonas palustris]|uniref:Uncharacterized protein n=1 Tax=Rhodopseudomonas palustris TaxID=1076 RepID=A0A933S1Z1_RHOPL|nr:hypothetical protein [Rhodopseudomonas palustris]
MKSTNPTTYLTTDELKELAAIKQRDAQSGSSGGRRRALMEEATVLEKLAKDRSSRG